MLLVKIFFGTAAAVFIGSRVLVPTIRWAYGWEDTYSNEYKKKKVQEFLEQTKEKPVIPNSNGENFF